MSSSPQNSSTTTQNNGNNNNNNKNTTVKSKGKQKKKGEKLDVELHFATQNWATIMENDSENDIITPSQYNLPEKPKALSNEIDASQIPNGPPFKVNLRNLHHDVEKSDLESCFRSLSITEVTLNRSSYTAVIEFGTKRDLIQALEMNNKSIKGRSVQMYFGNDDRGGYGDRDRRGRGGGFGRDNTPNDWRASRDAPQKNICPPPSWNYDQQPSRAVPYNRTSSGGQRFMRYGGGSQNDGFYDRQPSERDERYDEQRFSGRNRYDYGGGHGGGGGGDRDRRYNFTRADSEEDWRRAPPPPPSQDAYDHPPRGQPRSPPAPRYPDMPPTQSRAMSSQFRNSDNYGDGYRQPPPPPTMMDRHMDRRPPDYDRRDDHRRDHDIRSGHHNPPLMHHPPPRERLPSTRSNVSDQPLVPASDDLYGTSPTSQSASVAPKEPRRPFINPDMLKSLVEKTSDSKPASYSSIFGDAKPIDTSKKEQEIEQKIQSTKIAITATTGEGTGSVASSTSPVKDDIPGPSSSSQPISSRSDYHSEANVPPRHLRRTNGGGLGGGNDNRIRDYDMNDRNGALGGDRRGAQRNLQRDNNRMRNDRRNDYYTPTNRAPQGGPGIGPRNDRRGFNTDRRRYDDMGGSGQGHRYGPRNDRGNYDERNRYNNVGGYFEEKEDTSKHINYATVNKFDHLNEAEDHVSE